MPDTEVTDELFSFIHLIRQITTHLQTEHEDLPTIREIVYSAQRMEIPRDGILCTSISYSVHGIGCAIHYCESREIDVDIDDEGKEVFDPWRIENFIHMSGYSKANLRQDIERSCEYLVESGVLERAEGDWFRISDDR